MSLTILDKMELIKLLHSTENLELSEIAWISDIVDTLLAGRPANGEDIDELFEFFQN